MDEHTLTALEFDQVRAIAAAFTVTEPGRLAARTLMPAPSRGEAETRLAETRELCLFLENGENRLSFGPIRDSKAELEKAARYNRPLEPDALSSLATLIRSAHALKELFEQLDRKAFPALSNRAEAVEVPRFLAVKIEETIDARGRVRDWASEKLHKLRTRCGGLKDRIRGRINALTKKPTWRRCLQQDKITLRNGRYVLAVKKEHRHRVSGVIHGHSQTGETLYIEPQQVVLDGNDLAAAQESAVREEARILIDLTRRVMECQGDIDTSQDFLAWADLTFAKRQLVRLQRFTVPELSRDGVLSLHRARHPLLAWLHKGGDEKQPDLETMYRSVVPFDLELGSDFFMVIVTGPNTGGKTVVLKTIGLMGVMAAAGLPVPAFAPLRIPFYSNIYIDVGDEQSLQQSLSTFSSHMKQVTRVVTEAKEGDLVLLDELGAGTDPLEGAAMGMVLLDHLEKRKVQTVVSTHLGSLKQYAYTHESTENAAMEFDPDSLEPTYRVLLGIPGRSCALLVAEKLGFPRELLDAASQLIERPAAEEQVIQRMEKARRSVEEQRRQSQKLKRRLTRMKNKLARKLKDAEKAKKQAGREAEEEIDRKVKQIRDELGCVLSKLRNVPGRFKEPVEELEAFSGRILQATPLGERREEFARSLKVNNDVYVPILGGMCRVLRINKRKRKLTVQSNNLEADIGFDDVSWVQPEAE